MPAWADGPSFAKWMRMPKQCDTKNTMGDPIAASSASLFSTKWDDDVRVKTSQGTFVLTRTYAGQRVALGQTMPDSTWAQCRQGMVGDVRPGFLKAPFGNNLLSGTALVNGTEPVTLTSLTSVVDVTCSDALRVLTPEGDTRFFHGLPSVAPGQSEWVSRNLYAKSEPSRLRVTNTSGTLSFDWFHEDGRRFTYGSEFSFGNNGQYRLKAAYRADGKLFYSVLYDAPLNSAIPGATGLPSTLADGGIKMYPFPPRTVCSASGCTLTCSNNEDECFPLAGGQVCTQVAWDPQNCGACGNACAANQYCRNGTCGAIPSACTANREPVRVTFPESDLRLEFLYMNPPSKWLNEETELPNSECVLARIDAVQGANREALVEYEYDTFQTGARASSMLSRAIFSPQGGPNAWTKIQPGTSGESWSLGITEVRADPSVWNGESQTFVNNTEHVVLHGTDESGPEVSMTLNQDVLPQLDTARFLSKGVFAGCTNCCTNEEEGTYGRTAAIVKEDNINIAAFEHLRYYGADFELTGQRSDWRAIYGPLPAVRSTTCAGGAAASECQSSFEEYYYGQAGVGSTPPVLNVCEATNQPAVELARHERNGSFTQNDTRFNTSASMLEQRNVVRGASAVSSADGLDSRDFTYTYGASGQQLLATTSRTSLLDSSKSATTTFVRTNDVVSSVVRSGVTLQNGQLEPKNFAIFYRRGEYPCGKGQAQPEYVVAVVGPCSVSSVGQTSCDSSEFTGGGVTVNQAIPITEFYYYGAEFVPEEVTETEATAFNSGRLALVRQYPDGCESMPLDTVYGSYSATGEPGSIKAPHGAVTTMGYDGALLTSVVQPGPLSYSIDWDRGRVTRVTRPEGDSTVYCTEPAWGWNRDPRCVRDDGIGFEYPPPVGMAGGGKQEAAGTLHRDIAWVADVAKPPGLKTVRLERRHHDDRSQLKEKQLLIPTPDFNPFHVECEADSCTGINRYQYDFARRPVLRASGVGDESMSSVRYNAVGSVVAQGSGFDFTRTTDPVEKACSLSGSDDPRCTYFARDRLERLTGSRWPMANQEDCVAYDAHGNISVIARGCYNDTGATACPTAPTAYIGLTVSGGPTCGERMEFIWDDFGNLLATRRPAGAGTATMTFEYDAAGAVVQHHSTTQDDLAKPEVLWTKHDGLGRLTETSVSSDENTTVLTRQEWDSAPPLPEDCGSNFMSSNVRGNVAYSWNPVWDTWYGYDAMGRTVAERRISHGVESCTGDGDLLPQYNTTRYSYRPNGGIESIQYPSGRDVTYVYPSNGEEDNNLPIQVRVRVFGENVTLSLPILDKIEWTADKRIKSYRFLNYAGLTETGYIQAGSVSVVYDYGSAGLTARPAECGESISRNDGTGRLRRIQVVSLDTNAVLYERWFTWVADQVSAVDVCYEGQSRPLNEFNTPEAPWGFDAVKRLEVNNVVPVADEVSTLNLTGSRYTYDPQGNRLSEFIEYDWNWGSPGGWVGQYDIGSQLIGLTPASSPGNELSQSRNATAYAYDADGRQTQRRAAKNINDVVNATVNYHFPSDAQQNGGGVEQVLRTVELNGNPDGMGYTGLVYNYYYDGDNKRIRKDYPNGATEHFFYDLSKHLIAERSFDGFHEDDGITYDEYIYLGDIPIAAIRSTFESSFVRYPDFLGKSNGECHRRNEWGHCGITQVVADGVGTPVLALSHLQQVTGVGEYDAFGFRNRVRLPSVESSHPMVGGTEVFATGLGKRPVGNLTSDFRVRVSFLDAAPSCWFGCYPSDAKVEVHDSSGNYLAQASGAYPSMVSEWVAGDSFEVAFNQGNAPGGDGSALEGYDYDRRNSGNKYFPPLRFPGQYYDEETDLHENWNRYYDPSVGRYLSSEPMLQSPRYVKLMASKGLSVPSYSYAANNPLRFVDRNGLYFTVNASNPNAVWAALQRLAANPHFGWAIEQMAADPNVNYELNEQPYSSCTEYGSRANRPEETKDKGKYLSAIDYNVEAMNAVMHVRLPGLPITYTLDQVLGHELGHEYSFNYFDPRAPDDSIYAIDWDNATRGNGPFRLDHYQGGQCRQVCGP